MTPQQQKLHEVISEMRRDFQTCEGRVNLEMMGALERWRLILDAAESTLPKEPPAPKTRMVSMWDVNWCTLSAGGGKYPKGEWFPCSMPFDSYEGAKEQFDALGDQVRCVSITGPRLQEVPVGEVADVESTKDHVVLCCHPSGSVVVSLGVRGDPSRSRRTKWDAEQTAREYSSIHPHMRYVAVKVPS